MAVKWFNSLDTNSNATLYISQAEIEWICPKLYGTIPEHQGKFSHVADSVAGLASLGWDRF